MAYTLAGNEEANKKIRAGLAMLAEGSADFTSVASGIRKHEGDETYFVMPKDKSYGEAVELFLAAAMEQLETAQFERTFNYRPYDGAHAVAQVLAKIFGFPGFGKKTPASFFNPEKPPQTISIPTSPGQTIEVPWGLIDVPAIMTELSLGVKEDDELGRVFHITAKAPRLFEKEVKGFFIMVEEYLSKNSIYKGQAITASETPEFIDLSWVDPSKVIYREDIQRALETEVWFPIEHMHLVLADKQPTRWVTLMDGKFGTGKTLASSLTAKRAVDNQVTYIQVRPGKDDLKKAMQTAALYAPAVVAYEDLDVVADPNKITDAEASRILDAFDGVRSKAVPIMLLLTTNHSDKIHAGLLRAGRMHLYLQFGDLDAKALRKLLSVHVGEDRLYNIDSDKIYEACKGYEPAFMDLVIQKSRKYALARNYHELKQSKGAEPDEKEALNYRINTEDVVSAAQGLRPQWELMNRAAEQKRPDDYRRMQVNLVREALDNAPIFYTPESGGGHFANVKVDEQTMERINSSK